MCIHYWVIDSAYKGVCQKCKKQQDFSPPPVRVTKLERATWSTLHHDYYMRGKLYEGEMSNHETDFRL